LVDNKKNKFNLTNMTKYILHGGATRAPLDGNKRFFREALVGQKNKVKILAVYFAREQKDYDWMFDLEQDNFKSNSPEKDIEIEIASSNMAVFREQLKQADVIYVRGGDTFRLIDKIKQLPEFAELISGKIYAGSSAGVYLVAKYYYENDRDVIAEGLGILPIKAIAHWSEDKIDILKKLKNVEPEDMPIYKLMEGEFVVIEV